MPGIGVITNPRSRANRRDPARMQALACLLGSEGTIATPKTIGELYRTAEVFKSARIDILGISGGDGTLHQTLSAIVDVYQDQPLPMVAILRGGTLNTVASSLGIRGRSDELLYEVIDSYRRQEEQLVALRHLLTIGDKHGFIFGNGLVSSFLAAYYATGRPSATTGMLLLLRGGGSILFNTGFARQLFRRFRGNVVVDGKQWARTDFVTVAAATVSDIGLGFRPFPHCTDHAGSFALLAIHAKPHELVAELPRVLSALPLSRHKVIKAVASKVSIESEEPFSYTIDGDLYHGVNELTIATGPLLKLICPRIRRL
ncbi:MAG: diacylglycerol kinase family protein [Pseudomonadota bacterium]